ASRARGRAGETALERAMVLVAEARAALGHARQAITASSARRRRLRAASDRAPDSWMDGDVEATCLSCGRAIRIRYRATSATPLVAFPVACPFDDCEGVAAVEYPASAVEITVEPAPERGA